MPVVKAAGNWFYNFETDKFIFQQKFLTKLEEDALIEKTNKQNETY
ncbi:MAG: hypothetical protein JWQ09_320 [Segetibacter sp.]|nr:hypothetical protein [Segetibacter sp.]